MSKLNIKLSIADRLYPMKIRSKDEEVMRKSSLNINKIIKDFAEKYAVKDNQDLLAMCALSLSVELEKKKINEVIDEKEIMKEIETPMDMEVEVVEPISTENMMRMEEAANIAATAFGDDHVSVRRMRQEITKKRMEKKVKQTTLFQFVKKPTSASSVTPILSKPTFEGSPSFPCQFSNLSLQK